MMESKFEFSEHFKIYHDRVVVEVNDNTSNTELIVTTYNIISASDTRQTR